MAAEIVPIRLGLTKGDVYTLWAPRWRAEGDEWEAFLGKDEELFVFDSVADLVAFVRTDTGNDLTDHPAWDALTEANAHSFDPADRRRFDLVGVQEVVAEKPTEDAVAELHRTLAIVSAIGSVCDLTTISKFFNGNPGLGRLGGGIDTFTGRAGRKRWGEIESVIGRGWDNVVDAIDGVVSTPDVDAAASEKAEAELAEPAPEPDEDDGDHGAGGDTAGEQAEVAPGDAKDADTDVDAADTDTDAAASEPDDESAVTAALTEQARRGVLGSDEDFWLKVGIDPVRMITSAGTFYTLRCYLDDEPIFLGRNGRISVFGSERALARYLADEHDHDLSDLATYDDIRTAATDGSLQVAVTDDNVYVLTGIADDLAEGPDALDRDQVELAVELLRDVGDYSEDATVGATLHPDQALGGLVAHVLDPATARRPASPHAAAVEQWEKLEAFVESRLRAE